MARLRCRSDLPVPEIPHDGKGFRFSARIIRCGAIAMEGRKTMKSNRLLRPKLKRVLVATDLSPRARRAFARAAQIADEHHAAITILHVIEVD